MWQRPKKVAGLVVRLRFKNQSRAKIGFESSNSWQFDKHSTLGFAVRFQTSSNSIHLHNQSHPLRVFEFKSSVHSIYPSNINAKLRIRTQLKKRSQQGRGTLSSWADSLGVAPAIEGEVTPSNTFLPRVRHTAQTGQGTSAGISLERQTDAPHANALWSTWSASGAWVGKQAGPWRATAFCHCSRILDSWEFQM